MQVGNDPTAELFVWSAKLTNPSLNIIQCSDSTTQKINGVHHVHRINSDANGLMTLRLELFSSLDLDEPTIYVDNDIIFLQPLGDPLHQLQGKKIGLCRRDYNRQEIFAETHIVQHNIPEYRGIEIDTIYPYLACFTYSSTASFWPACLDKLRSMDQKFHKWYGDQEALRHIAASGAYSYANLPEDEYACVLDCFEEKKSIAKAVHFKGARKGDMVRFARHIGLIN